MENRIERAKRIDPIVFSELSSEMEYKFDGENTVTLQMVASGRDYQGPATRYYPCGQVTFTDEEVTAIKADPGLRAWNCFFEGMNGNMSLIDGAMNAISPRQGDKSANPREHLKPYKNIFKVCTCEDGLHAV